MKLRDIATDIDSGGDDISEMKHLAEKPDIGRRDSLGGWHELLDNGTGRSYYWNADSGESTWERPVGVVVKPYSSAKGSSQKGTKVS